MRGLDVNRASIYPSLPSCGTPLSATASLSPATDPPAGQASTTKRMPAKGLLFEKKGVSP